MILGAGMDTFAFRQPELVRQLQVLSRTRRIVTAGQSGPAEPSPAQDLFSVSLTIEHLDRLCD